MDVSGLTVTLVAFSEEKAAPLSSPDVRCCLLLLNMRILPRLLLPLVPEISDIDVLSP